jgi:hypothetical protein
MLERLGGSANDSDRARGSAHLLRGLHCAIGIEEGLDPPAIDRKPGVCFISRPKINCCGSARRRMRSSAQ